MRKVISLVIALAFISVQTNGSISFSGNKIYPLEVKNVAKLDVSVLASDEKLVALSVGGNSSGEGLDASASVSANPNIGGLPTVPDAPTIPSVTNNCGSTVLTRETPPNGVSWYWQGTNSNGTSTSLSGTTYSATSDGTYYIRAKDNTTGEWSSSTSIIVVVNTIPAPPGTPSLASYCTYSVLTHSTPPTNISYYWQGTNSNGQSIDNASGTNTVTVNGTYFLRARNNSSGCWSTSSSFQSVTIITLPDAPSNPTISSSTCGSTVLTRGTPPSNVTWYWQGTNSNGTSLNSSLANSIYTVTTDGIYYIRTYNYHTGCWSALSPSVTVDVIDPPTVPSNPTIVSTSCESVKLGHPAVPLGVTWYWQGTTSSGISTVNSDATYDVTSNGTYYLRAKNDATGCWSTTSASIVVSGFNPPVQPTNPTLTSNICGSSVLTRVSSPAGVTWYWEGENANGTSTDNSATTLTVSSSGTYYLRAKSNTTGCWSLSSAGLVVAVQDIPPAPTPPVITSSSCGSVVITKGPPPSGINWYWQGTNSGGYSNNSSNTYNVTTSGIYYLRAIKGSCWGNSTPIDINVGTPSVPTTPVVVSTSCEKVVLSISDAPPVGTTWYWQGVQSLGTSMSNSNTTFEATSNGTYYLRAMNDATGCWSTTSASIVVSSFNPPVQPTTPTVTSSICGSLVLTHGTTPTDLTWYWQGENANGTSTDNSATTLTVSNSGTYYLRAKSNTTGCWSLSSAGLNVAVQDIPPSPTTPIITSSSCGSVVITKGNPPLVTGWYWQGTDINGTITNTNQSTNANYTVTTSGTYYLRARNSSACWSASTPITVDVDNPPTPNTPIITSSSCEKVTISFNGTAPLGYTWYWQDGNSNGTSVLNSSSTYEATANSFYYLRTRNNTTGCWGSYVQVTINSFNPPAIPSTPTIVSDDCSGIVITHGTPPVGVTWYWQNTVYGIETTNSDLNYKATVKGQYYLRARNDATGCWNTNNSSIYLYVKDVPNKPIEPIVSTTNGNYIFTQGTSPGYINWYWQGTNSNGTSLVNANQTYTTTLTGTYYLRAYHTQSGCWSVESASASTDQIQFISAPPTPSIVNACGSTTLSKQGAPPQGITYYWQGTNSSGTNTDNSLTTYTVTSDGTYYIRARHDATGNWSSSTPVVVSVMRIPDSPTAPSQNSMCGVTELTASESPSGITWYWQGTNSNSNLVSNSTLINRVAADRTYYLRARDNTNGCWSTSSTSATVVIKVPPLTPSVPTLQSSSCGSSVILQSTHNTGETWYWQGNSYNGASIDNSGSTYTVDHDGTYYLRSKDDVTGCWSSTSSSLVVDVNDFPDTPTAPYITQNNCGSSTLYRYNTPDGVSWYWQDTIAGGQSTSNSLVNYNATADGVYYLRARTTSGCWSQASASISVDITELPKTPTTPIVSVDGATTILTRTTPPNGVGWYWQGTASTGYSTSNSNITYGVPSSGIYYLRTRDEATGCWSSSNASVDVIVNPLPATPTTPTLQTSSCGNSILLHGTPPDGITWYWQGTTASGTSIANPDLTFTAQADGTYYLRARDNNTGNWSTSSSSLVVDVNDFPDAPTPPYIYANTCGTTTLVRYTPPSGVIWYWQDKQADGQLTTNSGTNYSATTDGVYYLRARSGSGCWSTSSASSASVTVDILDIPAIGTQPLNPTFCEGNPATYSIAATGTGVKYQWQRSTNNGSTWENLLEETGSNLIVNSITPLMQGQQFKCRVSGDCPTVVNSNVVTLNVSSLPSLYAITGGESYCSGSPGVVIGLSGSQVGIGYQLKLDGNNAGTTISGTGSSISFGEQLIAGTYTVVAANADGCTRMMDGSKTVTVLTTPTATISAERTLVTCLTPSSILTATGDGSYQWSYNNGIVMDSTTAQVSVSPEVNTTYTVTVTNINGCTATASQQIATDKIKSQAPTSISADNASICYGASAILTVTGGSLGNGATWKWYSGSCNGTYVGTGATITVTPSTTTTYFVNAVGDCNTTECASIIINVSPLPTIEGNPISQMAFAGDPVTFSVSSPEVNPSYEWMQSTSENGVYTPISGANTVSHTIDSVTVGMDKTFYKCKVSSTTCPTNFTLSNAALLQVYNSNNIIHSQPTNSIVKIGGSASYSIEYDSKVTNLQWQRKKNTESDFTDISGEFNDTLTFATNVDLNYAQFRCKFSINGIVYYSKTVTLTLILPYSEPELTNLNYIYTLTPLVPIKSMSELSGKMVNEVSEQVGYFDGLGRPSQTISIRSTPTFKDLVQPVKYDDYGRETEKYLPYEADRGNGYIRPESTWSVDQPSFYNSYYEGEGNFAKSVTKFEESPLNRVLTQRGVGRDWAMDYNNIEDKVASFNYGSNGNNEVGYYYASEDNKLNHFGYYPAGTLTLIETTDEDKRVTQEWKDLAGRVILKRTYTEISKGGEAVETYYAYDAMGRLRYVLPPELIKYGPADIIDPSDPLIFKYGYYYLYDERGRTIEKRIPGANPLYMVYDNLDRLVLEQDGELRNISQWIAHTYDTFGRELKSGLVTLGVANTQDAALTWFNANTNGLDAQIIAGTLLTQNWYDSYDGLPSGFESIVYTKRDNLTMPVSPSDRTRGMLTAQEVRVLNPESNRPTTLKSKTFYDKDGRVLQTISESYDGGYIYQSKKYDWSGKVLNDEVKIDQPISVTLERATTYDHAGRVTLIQQRVDGGAWASVTANEYDALGKNITHKLGLTGAGCVQEVSYKYNIRGWLTQINDPDALGTDLFAMRLNYQNQTLTNAPGDPTFSSQYSGNICETDWVYRDGDPSNISNPGNVQRMAYRYWYDGLSRLTDAGWYSHSTSGWTRENNKFDVHYTYDLNGNINTSTCYGLTSTADKKIDDLTYGYSGNRLLSATDNTLKDEGYKDSNTSGDDFTYNDNGSMTADKDKGIEVSYNPLNLPQLVKEASGNLMVNYIYTAKGQKLAALYLNGVNLLGGNRYIGSLVYRYDENSSSWKPDYIPTAEGRLAYEGSSWEPQYFIKDHLGNLRSIVKKSATYNSNAGWAAQLWQQNYYPFGMTFGQPFIGSTSNQLGYNGKEKQDFELNGKSLDWLDYGARLYNPALSRFHNLDPLSEKFSYMTPYAYAGNNPIRYIDILGLGPGDPFDTPELAARDFGLFYNDNSIQKGAEFGTRIYQIGNQFFYGIPVFGEVSTVRLNYSKVPDNSVVVADAHTHGCYSLFYLGNQFSYNIDGVTIDNDIDNANHNKYPSYLITPNGSFQIYDPKVGKPRTLSNDMPWDEVDPTHPINENNALKNPIFTKDEPSIDWTILEQEFIDQQFQDLKYDPTVITD